MAAPIIPTLNDHEIERILERAGDFLELGGHLIIEIGSPQEGPIRDRMAARPEYELAPTIFDYSRHPRVLHASFVTSRRA